MYMSKLRPLKRTSTLALRQRRAHLTRSFRLPPRFVHASLIERLMKCGKANCHCRSGGTGHGPFFYLNRCFAKGVMQSLLLKSEAQLEQARQSVAAYTQLQEVLDEISQIDFELLRLGEAPPGAE